MITVVVCLFAAIIAVTIPCICVCSFIFGWGDFVQAMLVLTTIIDVVFIAYAINCGVEYD